MHLRNRVPSVAAMPLMSEKDSPHRKASFPSGPSFTAALTTTSRRFWWRCAYGRHPYPSRTRRLRRKRPMVLCWRRHGRVGGCQIKWGLSSVGRAPALQAGGREFESLSLHDSNEQCRQEERHLSVLAKGRMNFFLSIVRST